MRRTLEDYRSASAPANDNKAPTKPEVRMHFLGPAREAALRWRGFGTVGAVAALVLMLSLLLP